MQGRTELVLGVGVSIFVLRAAASGRLSAFWNTLWSGQGQSPSSSSLLNNLASQHPSGSTVDPSTDNGAGDFGSYNPSDYSSPSGYPNSKLFGLSSGIKPYDYIANGASPIVKMEDSLGLQKYVPGAMAAHDWDYATTGRATLPGSLKFLGYDNWTGQGNDWGNAEVFQDPQSGGVIEEMHLGAYNHNLIPGTVYPRGTYTGDIATNLPVSSNWTGPHLSVIVDAKGASYLTGGTAT